MRRLSANKAVHLAIESIEGTMDGADRLSLDQLRTFVDANGFFTDSSQGDFPDEQKKNRDSPVTNPLLSR
jgi:hypothetical protein